MITLGDLKKIIRIKDQINIKDDYVFDHLRIIKENGEENYKSPLFFPITITEEELKAGWYCLAYDKRLEIDDKFLKRSPNCTFVVESWMLTKIKTKTSKLIVVDNIMNAIKEIFEWHLKKYQGKVILVTGSIGKTSMVGLIEHIIEQKVYRIYSKRITPLVLYHNFINNINDNHEYVVLEAAMFYKKQVEYFSKTLKPLISIILNIKKEHLGIDNINSVDDIIKEKIKIAIDCENLILNNLDCCLKKIKVINNTMCYKKQMLLDEAPKNIIRIKKLSKKTKPYINTKLSILQNTVALKVAKILKIPNERVIERINNYVPVEKRINKEKLYNKEIIFDGDVSGVIRLEALAEHFYPKSILIIRSLSKNCEEKEDFSKLKRIYKKFNEIYIHESLKEEFDFLNKNNVRTFTNHKFINELRDEYKIFYHYGSYYRKFEIFTLENLERED